MRLIAVALVLPACAVGDALVDNGDDGYRAPELVDDTSRFARGSSFPNEGRGGVANDLQTPGMWVSMGPMVCWVEGASGQVGVDVFPDDDGTDEISMVDADPSGFLVVRDGWVVDMGTDGELSPRVRPEGEVVAGERLADGGFALVIDTDQGCAVQMQGETVSLSDLPCLADADIDEHPKGLVVATDEGVMLLDGAQVSLVAEGTQASVDPVSGALWSATPGEAKVHASLGEQQLTVDLGAPVVDLAARAGVVVALTQAPELIRLDAATGEILDRQAYVGRMDRTGVMLGDNGRSVVLTGPDVYTFYRVLSDRQLGL